MKLRYKVLIGISVFIVCFFATFSIIVSRIVLDGYRKIEGEEARENAFRVRDALNESINAINVKSSDWANWDDTYKFIQDHNPEFAEVNLQANSIYQLDIQAMIFYDQTGHLVKGAGVDPQEVKLVPVWPSLYTFIESHFDLFHFSEPNQYKKGLILLPEGPVLFSARGISSSDTTKPVKGTLFFCRFINQDLWQKLADMTHVKISADAVNITTDDIVPAVLKNQLAVTDAVATAIKDENTIQSYITIPDIFNHPAVILRVDIARDIYRQGLKSLWYFLCANALLGIITVGLVTFILFRFILHPIEQLSLAVRRFGMNPIPELIPVKTSDEIGSLAKNINLMFTDLQKANEERIRKNKELEETKQTLEEKITAFEKQNQDLEGTKRAVLNILEDERQLEVTARDQRDRIEAIISTMGEGLTVIDTDYKILIMNKAAEKLLHISATEVMGRSWMDVVHILKDDKPIDNGERPISKIFIDKQEVGLAAEQNYSFSLDNGQQFPVAATATPIISDDKVISAVILFRDITREKEEKAIIERIVTERTRELVDKNAALERVQHELSNAWLDQEKEKVKLKASINSLSLGFIMTDDVGNIITINKAAQTMIGISENTKKIAELSSVFPEKVNIQALYDQCKQEKKPIHVSHIAFGQKFLRLFIAPILMEGGQNLIGSVMAFEDITEAQILERSKDEFFSIASHELRTPLTAIRGNTELIRMYYGDKIQDQDFREMINDIHSASVRLITLVNDFLDASRLEQGKMKFNSIPFNLPGLIQESLKDLSAIATEKKITLEYKPTTEATVMAIGDRDKVKEVILNLVGNAMKFTEKGGVTVQIGGQFPNVPEKYKNHLLVTVTDTGRGIPLPNQALLFHKFQQAGSSLITRDTTKGTGLGLYISKLMLEGMNGDVFLIQSLEGIGSTFGFVIPKG